MTKTDFPIPSPKKSFWQRHALGACIMVASLVPLATNSGCSTSSLCPTGLTDCNGVCTDVTVDASNCSACGVMCATGQSCQQGACVASCAAGQMMCETGCVGTADDPSNCGGCGILCDQAAPFCSQGACSNTCAGGLTTCGNSCANTQTSAAHCGGCDMACGAGAECQAGACVTIPTGAGGGGGDGTGGTGTGVGGTGTGGGGTGVGGSGTGAGGGGSGDPLGGYHVNADWAGFAFTFTEEERTAPDPEVPDVRSSISENPAAFITMLDQDGPYCVSGSVPNTADYYNIAAIGFNVNQPKIEDAPVGLVASAGDGIGVDVTVNGGVDELRVQLEDGTDPSDPDAPNHRWCTGISGTGVHELPWSAFSTKCWCGPADPELDATLDADDDCKGNTAFDGREIAKVIIYVPEEGPTGDPAPFDFCINDIGPSNVTSRGTGEIVASCGNSAVNWGDTVSDPYGQVNAGNYSFQNNAWNLVNGSQTAQLLPGAGFRLTTQSCNTTTDSPCTFPSVYVGTDADGTKTSGFNPMPISGITSIPTCLGWSSGGTPASDEYNVSYDVWFNSNAGANYAEKFLMVWFRDPPGFQPAGMTPIATSVIGDQSWSVWFGPNHANQDVVSFVAPNKRADGQAYSFDLKDFIDEAVERGYLEPSLNLISIMGGMEIWGGGQGASIDGFRAEVQ